MQTLNSAEYCIGESMLYPDRSAVAVSCSHERERKEENIVRRDSKALLRLCLKTILADGWSSKIKL